MSALHRVAFVAVPVPVLRSLSTTFTHSVAALAGVTGLGTLVFYLYGRRLRGSDDTTRALTRLRRAYRVGLPVLYVVALVAMAVAGWFDLLGSVAAAFPGETALADTAALVVGVATPVVAVLGSYLGAFPAVRALRDVEMSAVTVTIRLARYLFGLLAVVVVLAGGTVALSADSTSGAGFLAALLVVVLVVISGSPWLIRLLQTTRTPTDDERDRLDRVCADVGLDPVDVRVLGTGDAKQATAFLRGVPGRRHLFVTDYLLAELDDERLRASLALQAGRARSRHLEVRLVVVTATLGTAGGLLLGVVSVPGGSDGLVALAAVGVGVLSLWAGQRLVYRADADAAARTDREAVEAALETSADLNDAPMDWGRIAAIRRMEPPLVRRIDRLRDRGAAGDQ
jgi:STE24 endopeptidase